MSLNQTCCLYLRIQKYQQQISNKTSLKEVVKKREEERVYYDHYKEKVRKMEEPG